MIYVDCLFMIQLPHATSHTIPKDPKISVCVCGGGGGCMGTLGKDSEVPIHDLFWVNIEKVISKAVK